MNTRSELKARLSGYWKMEGINMMLVPAIMLWLADWQVGWVSALPLLCMISLLGIGTLYWRAKFHQLDSGRDLRPTLKPIALLQLPMLLLTVAAVASAVIAWLQPELSLGLADRWVAALAALLGLLEYVNYYHRQLQHFDNWDDFKRLRQGRGFRVSQMARDIDAMRSDHSS